MLDARVCAQFANLLPETLEGAARDVWLSRSGRSIVRRFKLIKSACMAFESKRRTVIAARITGATDKDVMRVALMLFNAKGTIADAYDAIQNKDRDVGNPFPYEESRLWMESKGVLVQFDTAQNMDRSANPSLSFSAFQNDIECSESPDNECIESSCAGENSSRPMGSKQAKRRKLEQASNFKLAEAVHSIADSQPMRLEETKRRNNIALMQSDGVPLHMRTAFFKAMAEKLLGEVGVHLNSSAPSDDADESL